MASFSGLTSTATVLFSSAFIRRLEINSSEGENLGRLNVVAFDKTGTLTAGEFEVTDNGVGMDAETLNKLFTINKEVVNAGTRNEKGSGLGLILCKEFIEKMGGKIFAESKSGEGSVFTVTLTIDD